MLSLEKLCNIELPRISNKRQGVSRLGIVPTSEDQKCIHFNWDLFLNARAILNNKQPLNENVKIVQVGLQ